ncbi:phenazine biosynthesis-like domain-containing protein 1 isoform X2 [Branchiostoma floridae]|uniref:Phenazine biosynthesis-like domain-containing protein 1 isoform X2 n=1 Tax=Branchiostoma floridae TaxID=7739 RepID=A0A9J7KVI2_BRAFL|nr:phenazine biosynthesis-like domain-containing protein 1 isoform X2 [Branchiostoma floridae]
MECPVVVHEGQKLNKMAAIGQKWVPLYQVDAFTDQPFGGNAAAVCLLGDEELTDDHLQKIAAEMNQSETAFICKLSPQDDFISSSVFRLRWFTPVSEMLLCGHATLASAGALFYVIKNPSSQLTFQTLSGDLFARREGDFISLDLPENKSQPQDGGKYKDLIKATIGSFPVQEVRFCSSVGGDLLIRIPDSITREQFEKMTPDIQGMMAAHQEEIRGVIVTLKGSLENGCVDDEGVQYDFVSRFFDPWSGLPEDPVTGSAHTVLASYWAKELGKTEFYARQCSQRGGVLRVRLRGDGRVDVKGQAVVVTTGKIRI